jgi:hypothetical protein
MMASSLDDHGIQFPSQPEFTARYLLKSPQHADETRALFGAELIDFLQRQTAPLCAENAGRWLAIYRKNTTLRPDEIGLFSEQAGQVLHLLLKATR